VRIYPIADIGTLISPASQSFIDSPTTPLSLKKAVIQALINSAENSLKSVQKQLQTVE
jgi:hypothetical protein